MNPMRRSRGLVRASTGVCLACGVLAGEALAGEPAVNRLSLLKSEQYVQDSAAVPVEPIGWSFQASLQAGPGALSAVSLEWSDASGSSIFAALTPSGTGHWSYFDPTTFDTLGQLNSRHPDAAAHSVELLFDDGTTVVGSVAGLGGSLRSDDVPYLTNWIDLQAIDPTSPDLLLFPSWTPSFFATSASTIITVIDRTDPADPLGFFQSGVDSDSTSLALPLGFFKPNRDYDVFIFNFASANIVGDPSIFASADASFTTSMSTTIHTIPAPGSAVIMSIAGLTQMNRKRRRRQRIGE